MEKIFYFQHERGRARKKKPALVFWVTVNSSAAKQELEWIRLDETLFRRPRA